MCVCVCIIIVILIVIVVIEVLVVVIVVVVVVVVIVAVVVVLVVLIVVRERERNVLFNNALNTFYLRLYGVRYMVKDHSDSEKGNLLSPHRLLLSINSKGSFICTIPQTG